MPLVLRTIRQSRWLEDSFPWLEEGDAPADPLGDLATQDNELSVWIIDDEKSNLNQVVAAMAATRGHLSNLDFALFDLRFLSELNIKIAITTGGTPDKEVNTWHRDLVKLSALKIVGLSQVMMREAEFERVPEKNVGKLIAQAVTSKRIDPTKLQASLKQKVERLVNQSSSD